MTSFHDFEQAGWERAAEFYGDAFGALTAQTAPALLEAVGAARGKRLLDVACGPGFIAGAAASLGCDVAGLDFAAGDDRGGTTALAGHRPFAKAMPNRCRSTPAASTPSS